MGDDHRLAEQRPALGAADREGVGKPGEVGQRDVGFDAREAVAQTRPVEEQAHAIAAAGGGDRLQLALGVERAVFGRVGQVHGAGMDHVGVVLIGIEAGHEPLEGFRAEFTRLLRQRKYLVPRVFDGAGLVAVDVPGLGGDDALIAVQEGGEDDGVGLRAAREERDVRLVARARLPDLFGCARAVGVRTVSGQALPVRVDEPLQHRRVRALHIVVFKGYHGLCLRCLSSVGFQRILYRSRGRSARPCR